MIPTASLRLGEAAHRPPIEAGAGTGLASDLEAAPVVVVGAQRVRGHPAREVARLDAHARTVRQRLWWASYSHVGVAREP